MQSHHIPDYPALVKKHKRLFVKYLLILLGMVVFDFYAIYDFFTSGNTTLVIFCAIATVIGLITSLTFFSSFLDQKPIPIAKYDWQKVPNFSKEDIQNLVVSVFQEFQNREIPAIYILKGNLMGAFTIDTAFFNSAKNVNAIYMPESLFFLMNEAEIKAVILHEYAHFSQYMLPLNRFVFPLVFFILLAPIYLYFLFNFYLFLFLYIASVVLLFIRQKDIFFEKQTTHEYLSDFFAAERVGVLTYTNALLSISRENEIIAHIGREILNYIRKNKRLSIKLYDQIFRAYIKAFPVTTYSKRKIDQILKKYLTARKLRKFYTESPSVKLDKEDPIIDRMLVFNFMSDDIESADWSQFDTFKANKKIEAEEYEGFIDYLKANKDHALFRETNEDAFSVLMEGRHPLIRNRILFLAQNQTYMNIHSKQKNS
jgi:Zn-dependent protease with chaperone function